MTELSAGKNFRLTMMVINVSDDDNDRTDLDNFIMHMTKPKEEEPPEVNVWECLLSRP